MYTFGHWLTDQMRARRIYNVRQIAREARLDSNRVRDWVLDRGKPSADEAARLARYFGMTPERLYFVARVFAEDERQTA